MGLLKQDHNAIKLDLRAAFVLCPKRLSKNGQFKLACGRGARGAAAHAVLEIPMHARRRAPRMHETEIRFSDPGYTIVRIRVFEFQFSGNPKLNFQQAQNLTVDLVTSNRSS